MKAGFFRGPEEFQNAPEYQILPLRFRRRDGNVFLTNEVGEFAYLSDADFSAFVGRKLHPGAAYYDLKSKHFLADGDARVAVKLLATKVRTKRSFLDGFTRLHIFVVSLRCEHSCPYCQVSRQSDDRVSFDMTEETAAKAPDLVFRSPSPTPKIAFQGGEPSLNFPLIKFM